MTDYEDLHAVVITTPVVHLLHDVAPGEDRPVSLISSRTCWPTPGGSCNCVSGPGPEARPNQSCRRMKPSPPDCQACRGDLRCTRRPTSTCRARNETEDGPPVGPTVSPTGSPEAGSAHEAGSGVKLRVGSHEQKCRVFGGGLSRCCEKSLTRTL